MNISKKEQKPQMLRSWLLGGEYKYHDNCLQVNYCKANTVWLGIPIQQQKRKYILTEIEDLKHLIYIYNYETYPNT